MFKNLKISVKLLFSTFVFTFPIGVLLYFVISGFSKDIEKAELEKTGNIALKSVVHLSKDLILFQNLLVSSHQGNSNSFNPNILSDYRKSIDTLINQVEINCSFFQNNISKYKNFYTENSQIYFSPLDLKKDWESIKNNEKSFNEAELEKQIVTFSHKLTLLIRFIADESGLILDPDLDSYYLMDITALVLPQLQFNIGNIINIIQNSQYNQTISDYDINKVKLISDLIKNEQQMRIEQGIMTSVREDKNFYGESSSLGKNLLENYKSFTQQLEILNEELRKWYTFGSEDDSKLMETIINDGNLTLSRTLDFWTIINNEFNTLLDLRIKHFENLRAIALVSSGFAFGIAFILVLFVAKQISKHLGIVTKITAEIAEGNIDKAVLDLNHSDNLGFFKKYTDDDIKVNDEIIQLFKSIRKMTFNLSSLLVQVSKSGKIVSNTTFNITSSAHDIEATVAEQAALTNQVTATSNDISKTSTELANTMNFITESFNNNATMLFEGLEKLNEIKLNIADMFANTGEIADKLNTIKEKAIGINSVITTITKVANQTNLVSLNASIEAERAGIYGSGFAVVAREIRRLADQTSIAALNIEDMINDMHVAVAEGGDTISKYMTNTKNGTEKTSQIIDQISELIDKTNELPEKIFIANLSMKQQSESAVQINESMKQLNTAAIQTRNTIIEFNKATEKLNDAVKGLTDELYKFSLKTIS